MCIDMDLSGYSYLVDLEHPTGGHQVGDVGSVYVSAQT